MDDSVNSLIAAGGTGSFQDALARAKATGRPQPFGTGGLAIYPDGRVGTPGAFGGFMSGSPLSSNLPSVTAPITGPPGGYTMNVPPPSGSYLLNQAFAQARNTGQNVPFPGNPSQMITPDGRLVPSPNPAAGGSTGGAQAATLPAQAAAPPWNIDRAANGPPTANTIMGAYNMPPATITGGPPAPDAAQWTFDRAAGIEGQARRYRIAHGIHTPQDTADELNALSLAAAQQGRTALAAGPVAPGQLVTNMLTTPPPVQLAPQGFQTTNRNHYASHPEAYGLDNQGLY